MFSIFIEKGVLSPSREKMSFSGFFNPIEMTGNAVIVMRKLLLLGLLGCLAINLGAQSRADRILSGASRLLTDTFATDSLRPHELLVPFAYASRYPARLPGPDAIGRRRIEGAVLVYTGYPVDNTEWQDRLNRRRIEELGRHYPAVLKLSPDDWLVVEQTSPESRSEARRLFHGFVLLLSDTLPDFSREEQLEALTRRDSTVLKTLERNRDWQNMLVVTDLTGSMAPYTAQLLLWFKLNEVKDRIGYLVFFNDGDETPDEEKVIGSTGGIYEARARTFDAVAELANQAVEGGNGGDDEENNIEALLRGLKACPECEEVVMIADNYATPRDMELLEQVDRPVRVVLCGTEYGLNIAYLNLALETGGSIHTIEEDIENLKQLSEGEELRIGKEVFIIRDGKFELLRRI